MIIAKAFAVLFVATLLVGLPSLTRADVLSGNTIQNINENSDALGAAAGYDGGANLYQIVATVIKAFLGVLGVIFIIMVIIAGFNWMTAGGDEEKIKKAVAMIRNGVIGLIIMVSAYAITYFVFSNLPT